MDQTDYKILNILQKKARIPNVDVARQVEMAPSAVFERIKKLEARGIIDGYEVKLNPLHFNQSMVAFLNIRVKKPSAVTDTCQKLSRIEQVQEVHHLAGEDCILVKLRTSDTENLERILQNSVFPIENINEVKTMISLSTHKETGKIVLPEKPHNE
ncbi:MAG: Lrp/AsnC family transcriptional regulator [Desulfobacteraceae bacterium]